MAHTGLFDQEGIMSVIERAEQRMNDELRQHDLGLDNADDIRYWSAYLDGAKAQLQEGLKALVEYDKHLREKHEAEFRQKYRRALYDEALYDGRLCNEER